MGLMMDSPPQQPNKAAPVFKPQVPLPAFDSVIQGQSTNGSWSISAATTLAKCMKDNSIEDAGVRQALSEVANLNTRTQEPVYLTLLALFILQECFEDY